MGSIFILGLGLGQGLPVPVDPLKRLEPEPGQLTFSARLGYLPRGYTVFGTDEALGPYRERVAVHALRVDLDLSYDLSRDLTFGVGLAGELAQTQVLRAYYDGGEDRRAEGSSSLVSSLALGYRLVPGDPLDPSLTLTLAYPWALSASLGLSFLRDPVVLSLALEYAQDFAPLLGSLGLTLGAGFVANDLVSYAFQVTFRQPLAYAEAPSVGASFAVDLGLDPEAKGSVSLIFQGSLRGGETRAGLGVGFRLRDISLKEGKGQ